MTDELMQTDATPDTEQTIQTEETPVIPENGADQSPAEETKVTFDERQQAKVNSLIGEKAAATHAERRRADAAEAKIADMIAAQPKATEPAIPPMPDTFDDNFDTLLAERDTAIERRAEFRANANVQQQQADAQQQTQLQAQQQRQVDDGQAFATRSQKAGFKDDDMDQSLTSLQHMGLNQEVGQQLIGLEEGPQVVNFLAKNPHVFENMQGMSPMQAGAFIASKVIPAAMTAKQTTNAPNPADVLTGGGAPSKQRGAAGATFE